MSGEILMSDQDSHGRSTLPQAFLGMLSNGAEQWSMTRRLPVFTSAGTAKSSAWRFNRYAGQALREGVLTFRTT